LYTGGTSPVKGGMLVIAGATLYAISNVTEVKYFPLGKIISGLVKNKIMTYHNDSKSTYFNNWKEL
jgi:1,4-dihydroxy-2-naphthoate octaprenyltransferase